MNNISRWLCFITLIIVAKVIFIATQDTALLMEEIGNLRFLCGVISFICSILIYRRIVWGPELSTWVIIVAGLVAYISWYFAVILHQPEYVFTPHKLPPKQMFYMFIVWLFVPAILPLIGVFRNGLEEVGEE